MTANELCLIYAPVISAAVSILKKIPFVKKNPKVIALVLSIVLNVIGSKVLGGVTASIPQLVICVLESLAGSVLTYEAVVGKHGFVGIVEGAKSSRDL